MSLRPLGRGPCGASWVWASGPAPSLVRRSRDLAVRTRAWLAVFPCLAQAHSRAPRVPDSRHRWLPPCWAHRQPRWWARPPRLAWHRQQHSPPLRLHPQACPPSREPFSVLAPQTSSQTAEALQARIRDCRATRAARHPQNARRPKTRRLPRARSPRRSAPARRAKDRGAARRLPRQPPVAPKAPKPLRPQRPEARKTSPIEPMTRKSAGGPIGAGGCDISPSPPGRSSSGASESASGTKSWGTFDEPKPAMGADATVRSDDAVSDDAVIDVRDSTKGGIDENELREGGPECRRSCSKAMSSGTVASGRHSSRPSRQTSEYSLTAPASIL